MNTEEKIIQFFIDQFNNSNTNTIYLSRTDLEKLNISEQEASRTLSLLQEENCLTIKANSSDNSFSRFWTIDLKSKGINYFSIREVARKEKRDEWIKFWIPVALSSIAIIISVIALIKS